MTTVVVLAAERSHHKVVIKIVAIVVELVKALVFAIARAIVVVEVEVEVVELVGAVSIGQARVASSKAGRARVPYPSRGCPPNSPPSHR